MDRTALLTLWSGLWLQVRLLHMLFDVCMFGIPLVIAGCLVAHAVRDRDPRFWLPSVSMFCYCLFYVGGGREVLLYLTCTLFMMGGLLNSGGLIG